jgi:hypothetical protein
MVCLAPLDGNGRPYHIDEIKLSAYSEKTGKILKNPTRSRHAKWRASVDIKKVQEKEAARKAKKEAKLEQVRITSPALPKLQDFLEAYMEEKDGKPERMRQLVKTYVKAKKEAKNG